MKLKAPKTWQLIVILVVVFILAIGGSFLAVYLTTGFKPKQVYPQEIVVEDLQQNYHTQNSQYEVASDFKLMIKSPTEEVTEKGITFSFKQGISVTRTDDGKISDGIIIVPENVSLDEEFTVELVQASYLDKSGQPFLSNAGGISELVITTQNKRLSSSSIKIAVDVPVHEITLSLKDATTGADLGAEGEENKIAENTNFVVETTFYPQASRWLFSDDKNSNITEKREKQVFFDLENSESVVFEYNGGDVYFSAGSETSSDNIIKAYGFNNAKQQRSFFESNSQIAGIPLYSEAIRVLSRDESAVKSQIEVNVVEANVGSFEIRDTSTLQWEITTNKLFRLSAGTSALSDKDININISDIHANDLSGMIKNVGLRISSVKNKETQDAVDLSLVMVKGGESVLVGENEYVLINSQVKDLKHAYWEISTNGEYQIVAEVVLIVENENGEKEIFVDKESSTPVVHQVYFTSVEKRDEPVYWQEGLEETGISITIIYDNAGNVIPSQYKDDLSAISFVPAENTYQKKVFFAYYDGALAEGTLADYIALTSEGYGSYTIGEEAKTLWPLMGSELVVKDALDFNIIFASVRTDAYGNAIMTADGKYQLIEISEPIAVSAKKTLQGFESADLQIGGEYLVEGADVFAIPTGTNEAFTLNLKLKSGDGEIFKEEYNNGRVSFYATEDADGKIIRDDIFIFGEPNVTGDQVSVVVDINDKTIEERLGQDFYVYISYNNSISVNTWRAEPTGGDYYAAVKIYTQTPNQIINEDLAGQTFNVEQVLQSNGSGKLTITGGKLTAPIDDVDDFNKLINGDEDSGKAGTKVLDQYGREFSYSYNILSSNAETVGVTSLGGNKQGLAFGNGNVDGVVITVSAASVNYAFTINAKSVGIVKITVNDEDQHNTANVSYSVLGKKNTEGSLLLKEIVKVYVQGEGGNEVEYDPAAYTFRISEAFISSVDASLWDMFSINNGAANYQDRNLNEIAILQNFGQDITIPFVASNESGSLNFTFNLKIEKYLTDGDNNFNSVNYQIKDVVSGVRESDKPSNAQPNEVLVYAGYRINLNDVLKVVVADDASNFSWGGIDKYQGYGDSAYILKEWANTELGGSEIGKIETLSGTEAGYNGIVGTYITFNDVYQPVRKTFRLYTYFDGEGKGNTYAYYREVTVYILPNFEIIPAGGAEAATLSLADVLDSQDEKTFANYFDFARITENNQSLNQSKQNTTLDDSVFTDIRVYNSNDNKSQSNLNKTIAFEGEELFLRFKEIALSLNYNEWSRDVYVVAYYDNEEVAECKLTLDPGVDREALVENGAGDWLANTVIYDGIKMIMIAENELVFTKTTVNGLTARVSSSGTSAYSIYGTGNEQTISFRIDQTYQAGEDYYISIYLSGVVRGEGSVEDRTKDIVTIKWPMFMSAVGDIFASYQTEEDDLKTIIDGSHAADEIDAGKEYLLIAPDTIKGKAYLISNDGNIYLLENDNVISGGTQNGIILNDLSYTVTVSDDGKSIVSLIPQAGGSSISMNVSVGGAFAVDGTTYYVKDIYEDDENEGEFIVELYHVSLFNEEGYSLIKGTFGWEFTMFAGQDVLLGFNAKTLAEKRITVEFEMPNEFTDFMEVTTNTNILSINNISSADKTAISAYIWIVQTRDGNTIRYKYNLSIKPNGEIAQPVYPFGGNTEAIDVGAEEVTVDLSAAMGADTQHNGEQRISDKFNYYNDGVEPAGEATLTIKQAMIGDQILTISEDGFSVTDARFNISLDGMKVTFKNLSNAENVSVTLLRSYKDVYNGDIEYNFSINAQNIEYYIQYTGLTEDVWKLSSGDISALTVTTMQRNETGASSNVDVTKVETIITHDFAKAETWNGEEETATEDSKYYIYYDYENTSGSNLKIKTPAFISNDTTYHIYFSVEGKVIASLNVFVPATVKAEQKGQEGEATGVLYAGKTYSWDKMVDLVADVEKTLTVDSIEISGDGKDYAQGTTEEGKKAILFESAMADQEVTLKFNYTVKDQEDQVGQPGYVVFNYTIKANFKPNANVQIGNVIGKETGTGKLLDFVSATLGGNDGIGDNHPLLTKLKIESYQPQDANVVPTTDAVDIADRNVQITPNYVGVNTPTSVAITFGYYTENADKPLFTFSTRVSLTVLPAVSITPNYPQPGENVLAYESLAFDGENIYIENFFNDKAYFANAARLVVTKKTDSQSETIDYDNFSCKVLSQSNNITIDAASLNEGTLKVEKTGTSGSMFATLEVIYKGVRATYTIYFFDKVITSTQNATINHSGTQETVYADRTQISGLGGRYRLAELYVSGNAIVDSVYDIWVREIVTTEGDEQKQPKEVYLTSFLMKNTYLSKTIYVDHGQNNLVYEDGKLMFTDSSNQKYEVEVIFKINNAAASGVEFSRLAGRVEYRYATMDGSSILITSDELLIVDNSDNIAWVDNKEGILTIRYKIGESGTEQGETEIKLIRAIDIMVERAYNAGNPTAIDVEAHKQSVYRLVDLAGIKYASTGKQITMEDVVSTGAQLSVKILNATQQTFGNTDKYFKYQAGAENPYLLFSDIVNNDTDKIVYDFYLYAQGCAVDGDYALVEFTYTVGSLTETFEIAFRIVPDYQVTVGGSTIAEAGVIYEDQDYVTNQETPYTMTPDGETNILIAGSTTNADEHPILSVVRKNWNSDNIASSFNYQIKVQEAGVGYNAETTIGKLALTSTKEGDELYWNPPDETEEEKVYTNNSALNTVLIKPTKVMFGEKLYRVEVSDVFGYMIIFYFKLQPDSDQTPVVYEAESTLSFVEGAGFDVGVIYDEITIDQETKEVSGTGGDGESSTEVTTTIATRLGQTPNTTSVTAIILQNINAWGFLGDVGANKDQLTAAGLSEKYLKAPALGDVTISDITFKYDENTRASVGVIATDYVIMNGTSEVAINQTIELGDITYTYKSFEGKNVILQASINITPGDDQENENENDKFITLNGTAYKLTIAENAITKQDEIKQIGDKMLETPCPIAEGGSFKIDNKTFLLRLDDEGELTTFTVEYESDDVVAKDTTAKEYTATISLDFEDDKTTLNCKKNTDKGAYLATDRSLRALTNVEDKEVSGGSEEEGQGEQQKATIDRWDNVPYRDLSNKQFTVPTMPGWIYGANDNTDITVVITLAYKQGVEGEEETCEVSYNANITRNPKFTSKKTVVMDGQSFNLGEYIETGLRNGTETPKTTFYDDTLLVKVPAQGQVQLSITFKEGENKTNVTRTIINDNTGRIVSSYISLSEWYGKTLDTNVDIYINWSSPSEGASVWYHGSQNQQSSTSENDEALTASDNQATYIEIVEDTETEISFESLLVTNDTLYVEHDGRISGSDYFSVKKSYVIKIGDGETAQFYQYKHDFKLTTLYTYFDDGLTGGQTIKTITRKSGDENIWWDNDNGYKIPINVWGNGITLYQAKDSTTGNLQQSADGVVDLGTGNVDYNTLRFDVAPYAGVPPTAFFDEDGKTLWTGANYQIGQNQYIRVNVYVKVSGGPDQPLWQDRSGEKQLGFIILYLTGETDAQQPSN